jgi:cell division cycle protein 37
MLHVQSLQDCFDSKDLELLKNTIAAMPLEDAQYHMKRCVDSGLWVPGGGQSDGAAAAGREEEEIYADAS